MSAKRKILKKKSAAGREEDEELFEPRGRACLAQEDDRFENARTRHPPCNSYSQCMDEPSRLDRPLVCCSSHRRFHMWLIERRSRSQRPEQRLELYR